MSMTAKRCLFPINDTDRKQLNQELDCQARKIDDAETKRFMIRWGFNPVKDVEVEGGPYEITLLDGKSMPAMYTSGYRRRPYRSVPLLQARSPYQNQVSYHPSSAQRPTKRKLRFEIDGLSSNDENQDISESVIAVPKKQPRSDGIGAMTSDVVFPTVVNSTTLSPPASSPASVNCSYSPRSPSVLSSSCPPVLESDPISGRLCDVCPLDVSGLSRSLSASNFEQLSPDSQTREYITPDVRSTKSVKLVQRQITDYVPIRKARSLKANVSPRS